MLHHLLEARPGATRHAWLLHGILGSGQNLRSVARRLVAELPDWGVLLPDLRHHGESHEQPGPDTVDACAADLLALADHLGLSPETAIGHSFGGKVALRWGALAEARGRAVARVWALDVTPGPAASGTNPGALQGEVARVVAHLRTLPVPLPRRDSIVPLLTGAGFSAGLARWMTTNLRPTGAGYSWRFDLEGIEALLHDYARADAWPWLESPARGARVDVVRAARSERWSPAELARFEGRAGLHLHTLPDAGHWLHVDNPDGLHALLVREGLGREPVRG